MSKDPFLGREQGKYAIPVPSREDILAHLARKNTPASREELVQALDIRGKIQLEGLRRRLRAMERDGQLIFTRRQCVVLAERFLLRGTVIGHRDGFGFLRVEGNKRGDYYLSAEQMKMAIHGDVVMAQVPRRACQGQRGGEARIVRVIFPKTRIVGRFFLKAAGSAFVVPDDSRLGFDILIPPESIQGARMGFMVVVELTHRPTRRTKAIGKVIEVLGESLSSTDMVVNIALRTHEILHIWPPEVEQQSSQLREAVPEQALHGRIDLRALPLVTIDSEEARDFDDAVYCEKKRGGWRLWVAIADVSYYVRPDTALDNEASRRTTSVYFPSKVVPMLPEVLSNSLCALNPRVDRLCMVCEMTISAKGRLSSYKFYEAIMHSYARLTYHHVWKILQGNQALCQHYSPLIKPITHLYDMYKILEKTREQRGGIAFDTEEAKFILNTEHRIERIEPMMRNDAHKLIEECMILANISAARFVEKNQEPVLYRVHDRPSNDHIASLRVVLSAFGLTLGGGDKPKPKDYADMMTKIAGRPDYERLQSILLRSMRQAMYDPENRGHFGLALHAYTHFTSPIRRYPDLVLHRSIKYLLSRRKHREEHSRSTPTGGWHYEQEEMFRLGEQCSISERRADEATRDVSAWLKCDFMQNHVGEMFIGIITCVTGFGFFVRLNDLFIDGLVHISSLDNDYYRYDRISQRIIGESLGNIYRLGDTVKIRVEAVHMDERKIDFTLISNYRQSCEIEKNECHYQG